MKKTGSGRRKTGLSGVWKTKEESSSASARKKLAASEMQPLSALLKHYCSKKTAYFIGLYSRPAERSQRKFQRKKLHLNFVEMALATAYISHSSESSSPKKVASFCSCPKCASSYMRGFVYRAVVETSVNRKVYTDA